jgi:hypothetical protein
MNFDEAQKDLETIAQAADKIRAYCEGMLSGAYVYGVSSDHEAGYLSGQESACQSVLDILNGED